MSFCALPTELDAQICSFLDGPSLNSLLKTSKYYKLVAEPALYKQIVLKDNDADAIKRLLFTLVARRPLADNISSIELVGPSRGILKPIKTIGSDLWESAPLIQKVLDEFVNHTSSKLQWFRNILAQHMTIPSDHGLALVVCMAKNLSSLSLRLDKTDSRGLCTAWTKTVSVISGDEELENPPFRKLKSLSYKGARHMQFNALVSSLKSFELRDVKIAQQNFDVDFFKQPNLRLRTMVLASSPVVSLAGLAQILENKAFCELRELTLHRSVGCSAAWRGFLISLNRHTPELTSLRWTANNHDLDRTITGHGILRDLRKLRKLHVDHDILVPLEDRRLEALEDIQSQLPKMLDHLVIDHIDPSTASEYITLLGKYARRVNFGSLKRLTLSFDLKEDELMAELCRARFQSALNELAKVGMMLEVVRRCENYGDEPEILIAPIFAKDDKVGRK